MRASPVAPTCASCPTGTLLHPALIKEQADAVHPTNCIIDKLQFVGVHLVTCPTKAGARSSSCYCQSTKTVAYRKTFRHTVEIATFPWWLSIRTVTSAHFLFWTNLTTTGSNRDSNFSSSSAPKLTRKLGITKWSTNVPGLTITSLMPSWRQHLLFGNDSETPL